jgi:arylsulfatase A-like enzyme
VLWGDHGYHLGEQNLWAKHTNFESATRTALLLAVPGMPQPGSTTDAMTELVDVYPSLCDVAGLAKPPGLEGRSFKPLLTSSARPWKRAAFSQYPRPDKKAMGYSIRTESHRYTEWRTGWENPESATVVAREMYDHTSDPGETKNLAERSDQKEIVAALADQLKAGWKAAQK